MKLTIKQENFCNYYIESGNASDAYRRAYDCEKSTEKSINELSSALLNNIKVASRVNELKLNLQEKSDITKDRILNELRAIVFADIRDYVTFDGNSVKFKAFDQLTNEQAKAIESIKQTKDGVELKLHGKNWSIEKVCKMLGFDAPTKTDLTTNGKDLITEMIFTIDTRCTHKLSSNEAEAINS
ncbi:MAG: terminase small subunit [Paludibacter sp.]